MFYIKIEKAVQMVKDEPERFDRYEILMKYAIVKITLLSSCKKRGIVVQSQ